MPPINEHGESLEQGRFLPFLTTILVLGSLSGSSLAGGTPLWALPSASLALGLLFVFGQRWSRTKWLFLAAFLSALGHTARALERLGPLAGSPGLAHGSELRGTWQNIGRGPRGLIVPEPGQRAARWILEPALGQLSNGSFIRLRPSQGPVPWPRGPVAGNYQREDRFDAQIQWQPDECIVERRPASGEHPALAAFRQGVRQRCLELEAEGSAHGLVRALLLGERDDVAPATLDLFTRTGARHALALSGLHVALIAGFLLLPLSGLLARMGFGSARQREQAVFVLRLLLLFGFLLLVGAEAPVARAVCALCLGLLGPLLPAAARHGYPTGRRADGLSIWCFALIIELAFHPLALHSLSLRLSYMATLGILLGTTPIMNWGLARLPARSPRIQASGLRVLVDVLLLKLGRGLLRALAASIAAVLATLPEVATHFGEFSPTGVLFSPLVLPVLALFLISAWLSVLLSVDLFAAQLARALVGLLGWIDRLPATPWALPERPAWLLWSLVGLWLLGLAYPKHPLRALCRRGLLLGTGLVLLPWAAAPGSFELHLFDVGHGTCAVVRAPGLPALLFDAGSARRQGLYREAIAPLLASWEVPWVDVALSHGDRDHASGLGKLLGRYPVNMWMGALPEHLGERLAHNTGRLDLQAGRIELKLVSPETPLQMALLRGLPAAGNEGSRSLWLRWRGETIVLSGDAEGDGLASLLAKNCLAGPLRLLLFPHHGSETPFLGPLLEQSTPREIWLSAAKYRPPVVQELDRRQIPWFCTHREGPLALRLP